MKLSRIGFLSAIALLSPLAFYGANVLYNSVDIEDGTLVVGASYASSTTPIPTDLIALKKGQTDAARKELERQPTATTESPFGELVPFAIDDQQAGDSLTDALKAKYNAHRIRLASLPPYGEG